MTWTPPPPVIFKYDEKNKPEQYAAYTVQQLHEAHAAGRAEMAAPSTPAAWWRDAGQPDPHATTRYDVERTALLMGDLTDDELANAVFLHGNRKLTTEDLLAGVLPAITYLDAAKERIRWLSRALEKAKTRKDPSE